MKKKENHPLDPLAPQQKRKSTLPALAGLLLTCAVIALLVFLVRLGIRRLYHQNHAFLLTHIDLSAPYDQLRKSAEECLAECKVQEGLVTLPEIDLRTLRQNLMRNPRVANAEIQRVFPGTLKVTIKPRVPVAILRFPVESGRGELKIDQEGYVLPHDLPGVTAILPRVNGLANPEAFVEGEKTDDPGVLAFLEFLKKCTLRPDGANYEVLIARLDTENEKMTLHLVANGPFRDSAVVVMPTKDIDTHLDRIGIIVELKRNQNQTISYVNATYNNIPVRP